MEPAGNPCAINDSGARTLIVDSTADSFVNDSADTCCQLEKVLAFDDHRGDVGWEDLIARSSSVPDARRAADQLAGIFYTGGTTGSPKGVMLSHTNIVSAALGALASDDFLSAEGTLLTVAPLFHLAGIWPWVAQMALGGPTVVLAEFSTRAVLDAVHRHKVTDTLLVPTMIQKLVEEIEAMGHEHAAAPMPGLHRMLYAGSPMPESLLSRSRQLLPRVKFVQAYGMTELAPVATLLASNDHRGRLCRSVGRAAPHAEVHILDDAGAECARGTVGEIVVRGPHVMTGYWNQPDVTAAVLRGGAMHTGDLGYMDDDGFVFVVDRLKDMIISGGENVYSAEVENVLAAHPGVRACAVVGLPDQVW